MLARWGLGLCLDHQYVCQGDEHAGPLERKLQRVPKVATRFANCQLPIGREEHRESLCSLILCTQVRSEAWYSLLITTTMDSNAYTMHWKLPGRDFLFRVKSQVCYTTVTLATTIHINTRPEKEISARQLPVHGVGIL